ncbi:hypothetical protein S245_055987, partial [Arachis hypogaea]
EALELLIELAGTEPRFLRWQLVDVVGAMLHIAEAESLEEGTWHLAIEFVITLAEVRERAPGMMRKLPQFISRMFAFLMKMLLDIEDDPAWHSAETEDEDASETNNYSAETENCTPDILTPYLDGIVSNMETITLGDKRIGIETSVLEEKATACNMFCCYADELKEGFFPWIDQVLCAGKDLATEQTAGRMINLLRQLQQTLPPVHQKIKGIPEKTDFKDDNLVFVADATGRVGSRTVRELIKLGFKVRARVRSAERAGLLIKSVEKMKLDDGTSGGSQAVEKLEIVECDLEKPDQIGPALENASTVICSIGASEKEVFDITGPCRIDYRATNSLIDAVTVAKVNHFILVTSLGTNKFGLPAAILNLFLTINFILKTVLH